jgi:hypothetical protein
MAMATTDELQAALASDDRLGALRRAAERELHAGRPREEMIARLEELRTRLRDGGREDDEDIVLEVLDFVTGWCSPHMRV